MSKIPIKVIRDRLKEYHKGEISIEACLEVRDILTNVLDIIAEAGELEFQKQNRIRQKQNLPKIKRLDSSVFINLLANLLKRKSNNNTSEIGNYPFRRGKPLSCQAGDNLI